MKNQNWSGGRLKEISEEINRVFDGQPVVDAKNDLRIVILSDDIKKGKPKNFDECVFAQACKRVFNSQKVLFMRSICYISLPDENGNNKVERYLIPEAGKKVIADFDQGKLPTAGTSFVFKAPTKSVTLDAMKVSQRKHNSKKRDAKLAGKIYKTNRKVKHVKSPSSSSLDVRNGQGLIQMRQQA